MTWSRLIRRTIADWPFWRASRAMTRACPELRHINEAIRQARRRHRSTANLIAAKRAVVTDALRGGR